LTHKSCHECGASVPISAETCSKCKTFTGTVWLAAIAEQEAHKQNTSEKKTISVSVPSLSNASSNESKELVELQGSKESTPQSTSTNALSPIESPALSLLKGEYLDLGRRYRLLKGDSLAQSDRANGDRLFQRKVLDCQPLQKSVLGILLEQQAELLETAIDSDRDLAEEAQFWQRSGIPELAQPYLALKDCAPVVPMVHDAWLEENIQVILLDDRTHWQRLSEHWQDERPSTQTIVERLQEMLSVWTALSNVNSLQSLFIEHNLRISPEGKFGLVQIYPTASETSFSLPALGKFWQQILYPLKSVRSEALERLLEQLASSAIVTVEQLQQQLQDLPQQPMEANRKTQSNSSDNKGDASQQGERQRKEPPTEPVQESLPTEPVKEKTIVVSSDRANEDDEFDSSPLFAMGEINDAEDLSTAVLPMELLNLIDAGYTDRGRTRHHNEDFFGMRSQIKKQVTSRGKKFHARGLYVVCDGMGGHAAGEVASAMAVDVLQRYFVANWQDDLPDREVIEKGILLANQTIFNINQKNARSGNGRMGTTLVMALVQDTKVALAHVGDSRIYRIGRKGGLEQLTVDHEVGQRSIQGGVDPEIAYARPDAYQLTQALGPHANKFIQPDVRYLDIQEDTLLLLCSDGLCDNRLIETHWTSHLSPLLSSSSFLDKGLRKLIDLGNQHNGHDNLTAILVRMKVRPYLGGGNW
jgi:protein phosphatase